MRPLSWSTLVLGLTGAIQCALARVDSGITDIQITVCPEDNCRIPGYRKIPQDLNKYSRGKFVHLHFTDLDYIPDTNFGSNKLSSNGVSNKCHGMTKQSPNDDYIKQNYNDEFSPEKKGQGNRLLPITHIKVLQGQNPQIGPEWEKVEGNMNDGNHGPILTLFVKRERGQAPIESIVVKYGYDSHAAIGYDRLPMDLNTGTGGQWVYLYFKKTGSKEPITHIATKACTLPPCIMDDSWTRVNRPIMTGTIKRYLYLFYKSIPHERPITDLHLSLTGDEEDDVDTEHIDTGVRYKNNNIFVLYKRGQLGDKDNVIDNLAVLLGSNPVPPNWISATFEQGTKQEIPDWGAQIIFRTSNNAVSKVPTLRFKRDGTFKIVQFADIHMATGPHSCHNTPSSMECTGDINTIKMMERMLDAEQPDLVVYTGDNVDGLTSKDAFSTIMKYSKPVIDRGIPWTIIFGNHDEEGDLSREEMIMSAKDLPYALSQRGPLGISGTGNYVLNIFDRKRRRRNGYYDLDDGLFRTSESRAQGQDDGDDEESSLLGEKSRFNLYFLDSGAYSFSLDYPGWDWIKDDQVEWFRQTSRAITSKYDKDNVPNALAFFHIPIPEYNLVGNGDDDDDDDDVRYSRETKKPNSHMVGDKNEGVSTPSYNSGMFDAFLESLDVRATTAGHDHLNDYCLDLRGINLCYGGGLGYGTYGSPLVPRRSRVFEIRNRGNRVDTWKRLDDEEMTLVGEQTLFVGKKVPSSRRRTNEWQKSPDRRSI
ncbi:purple acid phosphatase [Entomortierella beljakovae]|nr:purple acid phosphatase [Entomortierella beljakovae]